MKGLSLALISTFGALSSAAIAGENQLPNPFGVPTSDVGHFGVRLGLGILVDSKSQSFAGTNARAFGLSYFLKGTGPLGSNLSVDVDNVRHTRDGRRFDTTYLGLTARKSLGALGKLNAYYGLGLGAAFVETRSTAVTNRFQPAGQLLAGVAVTERVFVEAVYRVQGKISGLTGDTLTLSLGARF